MRTHLIHQQGGVVADLIYLIFDEPVEVLSGVRPQCVGIREERKHHLEPVLRCVVHKFYMLLAKRLGDVVQARIGVDYLLRRRECRGIRVEETNGIRTSGLHQW
jgi:hypothetical protein